MNDDEQHHEAKQADQGDASHEGPVTPSLRRVVAKVHGVSLLGTVAVWAAQAGLGLLRLAPLPLLLLAQPLAILDRLLLEFGPLLLCELLKDAFGL